MTQVRFKAIQTNGQRQWSETIVLGQQANCPHGVQQVIRDRIGKGEKGMPQRKRLKKLKLHETEIYQLLITSAR